MFPVRHHLQLVLHIEYSGRCRQPFDEGSADDCGKARLTDIDPCCRKNAPYLDSRNTSRDRCALHQLGQSRFVIFPCGTGESLFGGGDGGRLNRPPNTLGVLSKSFPQVPVEVRVRDKQERFNFGSSCVSCNTGRWIDKAIAVHRHPPTIRDGASEPGSRPTRILRLAG